MDAIFFRLVNSGFLELDGLRADASVPVPEYLINEMITAVLQGSKDITECQVMVGEENRVTVHLKTPVWPWPLNLKLKLEPSVEFNGSPKIGALLENNLLLGKLGSTFKALPEGISLKGNLVVIDLHAFISAPEQRRLLSLVKSAEIHTKEAKVIFNVKAKVGEGVD
ncbi:MAG: hypothetical protein AB1649_23715 [Chloroflexota bacterium]